MKPYLETWQGNWDREGWKLKTPPVNRWGMEDVVTANYDEGEGSASTMLAPSTSLQEPDSGTIRAVPRFSKDLQSLLNLLDSDTPAIQVVQSKRIVTAFYGFGVASSGGFGATIETPAGMQGRYGLWDHDEDGKSLNYRELLNLVEMFEAEAAQGSFCQSELWLFADNSTAESCFHNGSSTSPLLHKFIIRPRKIEMQEGMILHLVHVAGTRMIAQGTDGLSRGMLLKGVLSGRDMLEYVDLSRSA
jgi:hypothetical protein